MANHEIVKYLVMNFNEKIDRQVACPLHFAVQGIFEVLQIRTLSFLGGSLKCVEHLIDTLSALTSESSVIFPHSELSAERHTFTGTAYECAKAITRSSYCIEFEGLLVFSKSFRKMSRFSSEWSEYAEIIDTLKKREQEKRTTKKKKKTKKSKFDMTDKENNEELINLDMNGHRLPNGIPNGMSQQMEKDLEGLHETLAQFKASGLVNHAKPGNFKI